MKLPSVVPVAYHPHAGFHYTKLLTLMILLALIIFQTWSWVAVGIGKFWFLDTFSTQKLHGMWAW